LNPEIPDGRHPAEVSVFSYAALNSSWRSGRNS